jgi:3-methyladenine DNA glycosylase/8-oxoguanine DNA glycosylase
MLEALFERYGALVRFEGIELCGFWRAATLAGATEEDLRALKVGYRARSLLHVSDALARGSVHEGALRKTTGRAAPSTASLYGVGPASVATSSSTSSTPSTRSRTSRRGSRRSTRGCF